MEPTRDTDVKETIDSMFTYKTEFMKQKLMAIQVLSEMANILNTGLDRETVSLCVSLCERGVNPEALAVSESIKVCFGVIYLKSIKSDCY